MDRRKQILSELRYLEDYRCAIRLMHDDIAHMTDDINLLTADINRHNSDIDQHSADININSPDIKNDSLVLKRESLIEERSDLLLCLRVTVNQVSRIERLLLLLPEEDQLILDKMLIHPYRNSAFDLMETLHCEKSWLYKHRAAALDTLCRLRYGAG